MSNLASTKQIWLIRGFKAVVFSLVVWGIRRAVLNAWEEFAAQEFALNQIRLSWLVAASFFYATGMLPMWWFWHRILWAFGQQPTVLGSLRAFFIGHLGKYVPGKAMVVVLRTSFVRGSAVDTTIAAVSVFVETLTMMAVGAFLAGAILAVRFTDQRLLQTLAWSLMVFTGLPTLPPVFRRLVIWLKVPTANPQVTDALQGLNSRLILSGWAACTIGWFLFGFSLWATLQAVPIGAAMASPWELAPRLTASVSLAMVAGFVSLMPGGILVRDVVLDILMVPEFGEAKALVTVVLLRLVWLVTELAISGILYVGGRARK